MFVGLGMMIGALLWARDRRRKAGGSAPDLRGPWLLGLAGAAWFVAYLWLVSSGVMAP
jgi:hypothetical protein